MEITENQDVHHLPSFAMLLFVRPDDLSTGVVSWTSIDDDGSARVALLKADGMIL